MVYARCNNCLRNISIPSNSAIAHKRVCQVCKTGFCSSCGTPFICRKCFSQLDVNDQQSIRQQSEKYRSKAGGGTAMTAIGAVLSEIGAYILYYRGSFILIILGLGLFIGGLSTMARSKAEMVRYISQASTQVRTTGQAGGSYAGGASWAANSPMIPSSAFIPSIQELPSQPAPIPASAFVPEPQPSPAAPRTPTSHEGSKPRAAGTYESVKFCGQCGERLPDVGGLRFCPGCGASTN